MIKKILKLFRKENNYGDNTVVLPISNKYIKIKIHGKNNKVIFSQDFPQNTRIHIEIYGDNNTVDLGCVYGNIKIMIGYAWVKTHNTLFKCGYGRINQGEFLLLENNTHITIGDDCLFSWGISFRCTDDHTIMDMNGNIINHAKFIEIGNHVWIAKQVTVLKNTKILDNTVVGCNSVVAKQFDKSNIVIAGNPARIIKENINLDEKYIHEAYNENI